MLQTGLLSDGLHQTPMILDRSGIPKQLSNRTGVLYKCALESAKMGGGGGKKGAKGAK